MGVRFLLKQVLSPFENGILLVASVPGRMPKTLSATPYLGLLCNKKGGLLRPHIYDLKRCIFMKK